MERADTVTSIFFGTDSGPTPNAFFDKTNLMRVYREAIQQAEQRHRGIFQVGDQGEHALDDVFSHAIDVWRQSLERLAPPGVGMDGVLVDPEPTLPILNDRLRSALTETVSHNAMSIVRRMKRERRALERERAILSEKRNARRHTTRQPKKSSM